MGEIGPVRRKINFEPLDEPAPEPVTEPEPVTVPAEPVPA